MQAAEKEKQLSSAPRNSEFFGKTCKLQENPQYRVKKLQAELN